MVRDEAEKIRSTIVYCAVELSFYIEVTGISQGGFQQSGNTMIALALNKM